MIILQLLCLSGPVDELDPARVDHYKCYKVRTSPFKLAGVQVEDQFASLVLDMKKPQRLCVAADKNGEGILNPDATLLCFTARQASRTPRFRGTDDDAIFTNNQFGPDNFDIFRPREFCVPSMLNP